MKKILFLLCTVLLCSCEPKNKITTFEYKGHSYISFGVKGVVHDPDCQYCYDKFD